MTTFDWDAYRTAVAAVIQERGMSDREAARGAGVNSSLITRTIRHGNDASVENTARLADWAGLSLDAFMERSRPLASPFADEQRSVVAAMRASEAASMALRWMLGGDR